MKLDVYKRLDEWWSLAVGACTESSVHKLKEDPND